jgi:hypothetical protein
LTAMYFDTASNNQLTIDSAKWSFSGATAALVALLLKNAVQQQLIVPAPTASPKPALAITAADPGSAGNNITVTTAITTPNLDPTQVVFSITIGETDFYSGLKIDTLGAALGTDVKPLPNPGLVHALNATLPASGLPAAITDQVLTLPPPPPPPPLPGPSARIVLNNNVKPTPGPFVTLEAKKPGPDGILTTVTVGNVNTTNNTFDLTVKWSKQATGVTLLNLQAKLADLGYEIVGAAPPSGIISVPAGGSFSLTGGADGSPGTAASAVIFANQ